MATPAPAPLAVRIRQGAGRVRLESVAIAVELDPADALRVARALARAARTAGAATDQEPAHGR